MSPISDCRAEAVTRLRSIEGHVRGVEKMIADEQQCLDIVRQILAIQGALEKLSLLLLEGHLQERVSSSLRDANAHERQRIVDELIGILGISQVF